MRQSLVRSCTPLHGLILALLGVFPFVTLSVNARQETEKTRPPQGDDAPFVLKWHGQSFFELTTPKGTRVVIDPHAIEAYGRKTMEADLVLLSHLHTDHTRLEPITNKDKAKVLNGLKPSAQPGRGADFTPIEESFKDINLKNVLLYHDAMEGMQRGKNTAWILETGGLRIVHLGDLGHKLSREQIRQIGQVDVLMIPVGGIYTINGSEAREVVDQLKPKRIIIPMHHSTRVYEDLLSPDEFLEELPKERIKKLPINKIEFRASDPVPPAPLILMPNFE